MVFNKFVQMIRLKDGSDRQTWNLNINKYVSAYNTWNMILVNE